MKSEFIGTVVYDLPTGHGNPRNSEGAFIRLKDGRIMFAYSHFYGDELGGDDAPACLAAVFSADDGVNWGGRRIIMQSEADHVENIMSVSLVRMLNGYLGMFYIILKNHRDALLYLCVSKDEGKTWSARKACISEQGYYVVNNDRVIRLSSGRLIFPAAFHRVRGKDGDILFCYSDDDGNTWKSTIAIKENKNIKSKCSNIKGYSILQMINYVIKKGVFNKDQYENFKQRCHTKTAR